MEPGFSLSKKAGNSHAEPQKIGLQNFSTNGFALLKNNFDFKLAEQIAGEIERVHTEFESLKQTHTELYKLGEWSIRSPHTVSPVLSEFIFSSVFEKICQSLVGKDVDMYWTTTAAKPAQRGKAFPWHQDAGYGKGPSDYITCWIALDHVDQENGCLWAIPNTHAGDIFPHEFRKSNDDDYAGLFLKNSDFDFSNAQPLVMQPGDILCMDSKLIHASTPNFSGRKRRGLIVAYAKSHLIEKHKDEIEEITVPFLRDGRRLPV